MSSELHHNAEPLQKYFPLIGDPVAVTWTSRDNSGRLAPGPTTVWLDAIVELAPATAVELRNRYATTESTHPVDLPAALQSQLPAGNYATNPDFDTALGGSPEWNGTATGYLHTDRPILVFTAMAGG